MYIMGSDTKVMKAQADNQNADHTTEYCRISHYSRFPEKSSRIKICREKEF